MDGIKTELAQERWKKKKKKKQKNKRDINLDIPVSSNNHWREEANLGGGPWKTGNGLVVAHHETGLLRDEVAIDIRGDVSARRERTE